MKTRLQILLAALATAGSLFLAGCAPPASSPDFLSSLTFFASFDRGFAADVAAGDAALYVAPSPVGYPRRNCLHLSTS